MKLDELIFADAQMPEKDLTDASWFDGGEAITSLEGNRYHLFRRDSVFYVRDTHGELLGWIELDGSEVRTIYVAPAHRRQGIGLTLLHAVKELLGSVIFPDVISPDGASLINRMLNKPQLFKLSLDIDGVTEPFSHELLHRPHSRLIIEGKIGNHPSAGLSAPGVPGSTDPLQRSAYTWFSA